MYNKSNKGNKDKSQNVNYDYNNNEDKMYGDWCQSYFWNLVNDAENSHKCVQQIMLSIVTWQQRATLNLQFFFVVVVEILY